MKKIAKYDLEGNFLENYDGKSYFALAKKLRLNYTSFIDCLSGRILSTNGFQFINRTDRHLNLIGDVSEIRSGVHGKLVTKKYNGKVITMYKSIAEASRKNDISESNIHQSIRNSGVTNGFTFEFANQLEN